MENRQINKWLRRRFRGLGWQLIGYYFIMNLLASLAMLAQAVSQMAQQRGNFSPQELDLEAVVGNAWGYILTVAVGLVVLYAWKGADYWKREIFAKSAPITPGTVMTLCALMIGTQMVSSLWIMALEAVLNLFDRSLLEQLQGVSGASDSVSMFVYTALLAPVAEEILFRGYILRSLRPYGKRFAILISAFLFGLFHGNLMQIPYAFLVGLLLGYVTVEYSIHWAIGLHVFNNLVLADLFSRLLDTLPELAANALGYLVFGGFFLASLVILALHSKQIRVYRRGEWIDRRCVKCFFTNSGTVVFCLIMGLNVLLTLLAT